VRLPCLIATLALAGKAHAALPPETEIPFESCEGLLWVKASSPHSTEPLNLLLDTGAAVTVLNNAAADRLKLAHGRRITVQGVGTTLSGSALKPAPLTANGIQLPSPGLAVDLQKFSDSCSRPVDGLLGADFFRRRIVQLDFSAGKLRILAAAPAPRLADTLPLQFRSCGIRVPVSVNGRKPEWVRLDTGCASALQWVTSSVRAEDCIKKPAIGLAEVAVPQTETTVQLGSHNFDGLPTGIHDKPIFMGEAGLLGNGLLSRFSSVIIDGKSRRLILGPRRDAR
jgi:hypothetical protein